MIKYCLDHWNKNQEILRKQIENDTQLQNATYEYLVILVTKYILGEEWNYKYITVIDHGNYQGTVLFLIPRDTYQPSEYDYLMTYVGYGSCSYCDTLQYIQSIAYEATPTQKQVDEYMILCKDLITNMIRPYNIGWRDSKDFETVTIDD